VTFQSLRSSTMISPSGKLSKDSSERFHFGFAALHPGRSFSGLVNYVSCLLLDLVMPGTNGLEVTQELGARGLRIPTVFVPAHGDDEVEQHLVAAGAIAILAKPVDHQMLFRLVQTVVDVTQVTPHNILSLDSLISTAELGRTTIEHAGPGKDTARCGAAHSGSDQPLHCIAGDCGARRAIRRGRPFKSSCLTVMARPHER